MFGGSSSSSSGGPSPSCSSSRAAVSMVIRSFPSYHYCFTMTVSWMMTVILVSSTLVVQRSESFVTIPTPTTIRSSRHHPPVIQHNHGHYYFDNGICSSNRYSVRRGGAGLTALSSVKQQSTNEEEKQLTTKKKSRRTWEESFELLRSYKERNGNCNVPFRYKEDPRLGNWVNSQRTRKDKLSDECIAKLDDLGFSWSNELRDQQWEEMFEKLVQYAKENNGDCNVPGNHDNNDVNKELYLWVKNQRWRKSLLSKERQAKLDKLGLIWEDANKVKADHKWNEQYERLREYKQTYGHCRVPQKWKDDPALGEWVFAQRQKYRKGRLREDRQMKLEQIDFTWKVRDGGQPDYVKPDSQWFVKFGILNIFLEEHGHCNVPLNYKKDNSLGNWVHRQRKNQKYGTLRQDRKEQLDDIGFMWNFDDQKDEQWNEKYEEIKRFKEQNGHLRLPSSSSSDRILRDWACRQRVLYAAGKVAPERKALLDEIEFRWETQNSSS